MVRQRVVGLKRFEACVARDGYLVGSHGDRLCTASLRTGEIVPSKESVDGDPKRRVIAVAGYGPGVLTASHDGVLTAWDVDAAGMCASRRRVEPSDGTRVLAVATDDERWFAVLEHATSNGHNNGKKRKWAESRVEVSCWSEAGKFALDASLPKEKPVRRGLVAVRVDGSTRVVVCLRSELRVYAVGASSAELAWRRPANDQSPACCATASAGSALHSARLATAHLNGAIRLWHGGLLAQAPTTTPGVLHWHASRVGALCASKCGGFLLSGGDEGVLVIWQLGTADKTFVPRLGAPITNLAEARHPDDGGPVAVVVTADAATHVIHLARDLATLWTIRGLCLDSVAPLRRRSQKIRVSSSYPPRRVACGVAGRRAAMNARPGCLDVYDASADRVVATLEVVPHNRVRSAAAETPRQPAVLAVSWSADWVATVDAWLATTDEFEGPLRRREDVCELKLWRRQADGPVLRAVVPAPHDAATVVDLAFHPTQPLLGSAANDGSWKLWQRDSESNWICALGGSSPGDLSSPSSRSRVALSDDGTVAAHVHGASVHIWNLTTRTRATTLEASGDPLALGFGFAWSLVAASTVGLVVFDLRSFKRHWAIDNTSFAAADVALSAVAVAPATTQSVVVYSHNRPEPLATFPLQGNADPSCLVFLHDASLLVVKPAHLVHVVWKPGEDDENDDAVREPSPMEPAANKFAFNERVFASNDGAVPPQRNGLFRDLAARLLDPNPAWPHDADQAPSVDLIFDAYFRAQFRRDKATPT